MGFDQLWPLAFLVLVPIILILYILKQQAKPYSFSSVLLWQESFRNLEATKPWEKLRRNLLLFLQILILLLLIAALMGPWISSHTQEEQQVVLVIDNSASMGSLNGSEEETRLDAAKEAACDYVDSLGSNADIHVIMVNQQAVLCVSGTKDHSLVKQQIRSIGLSSLGGDPSQALGLVSSCINGAENPEVVFFTDTAFDMGDLSGTVESFWSEGTNLALTSLSSSEKDGEIVVLVSAENYSENDVTEDVNLYGIYEDGSEKLLAIESLTAEAGKTSSLLFELESEKTQGVCSWHAQLNDADQLAGDNDCWCTAAANTENKVLLLTDSNIFLEKAFEGMAGTEVYRTSDLSVLDSGETYDLYIFDGLIPEKLPDSGSFLFVNCNQAADENADSWFTAAEEGAGQKLTLEEGEITDYIFGKSIGVNKTCFYDLPQWGTSFLTGNGQCAGFYGIYDSHRTIVLGFDLHQTDFALTADFPVMIADFSEYLLKESLVSDVSITVGESLILYGNSAGEALTITCPDQTVTVMDAGEAYGSYYQAKQTGAYHVSQTNDGKVNSAWFTADFPYASESDPQSAQSMTSEDAAGKTAARIGTFRIRRLLLILAALLLALEWIVYIRQMPEKRKNGRRIGERILRLSVFVLIILAFAGITIKKTSRMTTTVFVMDLSDSMKNSIDDEEEFVRSAIADMPAKEQAAIVVFGSDAKIEQFVSDKKSFTKTESTVIGSATDIEQAVSTAMALFPEETAKRLVLLTDGEENEGSISDLTASLTQKNVEIKLVEYDNTVEKEVYVSSVSLPDQISQGESFQVTAEVYASEPTQAVISLYSGRTLKDQKSTLLQKGNNKLVFSDTGIEEGIRSYRVTVEADADTVTVNNTYSAFTNIEAPARILLIEGSKGEGSEMEKILTAGSFSYETITPEAAPDQVSDLLRYSSVILLDVYADDLRDGFQEALDSYVKDYAGGLICIGGSNSYALGNYQNTLLDEMLPVSSTLTGEKQVPSIALVMVIDHSGSMEDASTENGSVSCLNVAKNAAINALSSLRSIDQIGVIAFDDSYDWAVELQSAADTDAAAEGIRSIPAGGGTNIYPAVEAAAKALEKSSASIKHIILLTDGQDGYHGYDPLLQEINDNGISLSAVGIGSGADVDTLKYLASSGNGRYYYSDAGTSLPRIFAQEIFLSARSYLINEEFVPAIVNSHEIINGIFTEGSPSLKGYVATSMRSGAIEILETSEEDPLLAVRQYGLGRTVAWTSDATGEWTGNFSSWENYSSLWKNVIDWSITGTDPGEDTVSVTQEASSFVIHYETADYSAKTSVQAVITDEDGNQSTIELHSVSPGVYEAQADADATGIYSISLRRLEDGEIAKSINTAAAMQYSQEYRFADITGSLDQFASASEARRIEKPEEVFDTKLTGAVSKTQLTLPLLLLALLFFIADIVCRRLSIDWIHALGRIFSDAFGKLFRRSAPRDKGRKMHAPKNRNLQSPSSEAAQNSTADSSQKRFADKPENPSAGSRTIRKNVENSGETGRTGGKNGGHTAGKKNQPDTIDTAALLQKKKDRRG